MFAAALLVACATTISLEERSVYDVVAKQYITPAELVQRLSNHEYILLGERHTSQNHHRAHQFILNQLLKDGAIEAVVVEMMPTELQDVITATQSSVRAGEISDGQLVRALNWPPEWDWNLYKDFISAVLASDVALIAGNLSKQEVQVILNGAQPLRGDVSTSATVQQKIAKLIKGHHIMDGSKLSRFVQVQQFRDRRMAQMMVESESKPVLLKAGNLHVDKSIGVPLHLKDYGVLDQVNVIFANELADINDGVADYVWLLD